MLGVKDYIGSIMIVAIMVSAAGCASSGVTKRASDVPQNEVIEKPKRVLIYDFAGTPADIDPDAAIAGHYSRRDVDQDEEDIQLGRQLGAGVAKRLAEKIGKTGFETALAAEGARPRVGDLVIKGEFISIDEGSRTKRVLVGFGWGAAELKTHVEAYEVTPGGIRRLGTAQVEAEGGKMPGMVVPVAGSGAAAASVAVSGGVAVVKERGPESIHGAAERTADSIFELLHDGFVKRGWIAEK